MSKAPRENRVPIMFSAGELTAIDDWRFENRIATRADAVRRLCQIGFASSASVDEFDQVLRKIDLDLMEFETLSEEIREIKSKNEAVALLGKATNLSGRMIDTTAKLVEMLSTVNSAVIASSQNDSIDELASDIATIIRRISKVRHDPRQMDWLADRDVE